MLDILKHSLHDALSAGSRWCIALSGGVDSSALLHAVAALAQQYPDNQVRAIHIHHHLHADADQWAERCIQLGAQLAVPVEVLSVEVADDHHEGLEAAARRARYRALEGALLAQELLLTAHHLDDQVETFLLRLMRGAGPRGLGGIRQRRRLGKGWLLRPLLLMSREELESYAQVNGLTWVEDPANSDTRFDRNFLRHRVLPLLRQRWPGLNETVSRAARLSDEAALMLDALAEIDAQEVVSLNRLQIAALLRLSSERQRNLMRYVLHRQGLQPPSEVRLKEGMQQLLKAAPDREPVMELPAGQVRRYRDYLHVLTPEEMTGRVSAPAAASRPWDGRGACDLGGSYGRIYFADAAGVAGSWPATWEVRFRVGGERIQHGGCHKSVKKLLQEHGIVPWMRQRIPLLYRDEELFAVAGVCTSDEFRAAAPEGLQLLWEGHAAIS